MIFTYVYSVELCTVLCTLETAPKYFSSSMAYLSGFGNSFTQALLCFHQSQDVRSVTIQHVHDYLHLDCKTCGCHPVSVPFDCCSKLPQFIAESRVFKLQACFFKGRREVALACEKTELLSAFGFLQNQR